MQKTDRIAIVYGNERVSYALLDRCGYHTGDLCQMQDGKVMALTAFVLLEQPDGESSLARARRVKTALAACLPSYMIPHKILAVDPFPLNTNGKIDKKQLAVQL